MTRKHSRLLRPGETRIEYLNEVFSDATKSVIGGAIMMFIIMFVQNWSRYLGIILAIIFFIIVLKGVVVSIFLLLLEWVVMPVLYFFCKIGILQSDGTRIPTKDWLMSFAASVIRTVEAAFIVYFTIRIYKVLWP